jgi:hypothetical protein
MSCTLSFKTSHKLVAAGIADMANHITLYDIAPCSADGGRNVSSTSSSDSAVQVCELRPHSGHQCAHCCQIFARPRCSFNTAGCGFSISLINASYSAAPRVSSIALIRACTSSRCKNKTLYSRFKDSFVACAEVLAGAGVEMKVPVRSAMLGKNQLEMMMWGENLQGFVVERMLNMVLLGATDT